jgi:general secretion pathway protein D
VIVRRRASMVSMYAAAIGCLAAKPSRAQAPAARASDSVSIRIVGTELRAAVQIIQQYLDRPIIFSGAAGGPQVTLDTPRPVARADIPKLLRGLLDAHGYELVDDSASGTYRARPKEQPRSLVPSATAFAPASVASAARRQSEPPELYVIALRHARAATVASTINSLFGRATDAGPAADGGARRPTLRDELRADQVPPIGASPPQAIAPVVSRPATLSGDVTIVPDAHANSLLVRANRADFDLIQAAVQQIDVRPAQVLIEVLIVEARHNRDFSLGVEASMKDHAVPHTANSIVGAAFTPASAGLGDFTLKVMGVGPFDIDATIRAAASRGDVQIVSRPVVLAENDEAAEVVVGSQRPFVQVSRALPTDAAVRDQIVQYRDVGTKLNVRPTISIDGTVSLSVTQEVSSATAETAFDAPVIATRSVKTELLVMDGQTIVLGGLSDHQHDVRTSGIPLLSRIPFLGGLFGSHARNSNDTELFIFLTPRVIRTDDDARRLTEPLTDRAKRVRP